MDNNTGLSRKVGPVTYGGPALGIFNMSGGGKSTVFFSQSSSQSALSSQLAPGEYQFGNRTVSFDADGSSSGIRSKASAERHKIISMAHAKFVSLANSESFEYGYTQPSEQYLTEFSISYPALLGELAQGIALKEGSGETVMIALLNAISGFNYDVVRPWGQILAVSALTNLSVLVKEAAIRVYETWGHAEGARILTAVDCPWPWLDKYRRQVIIDIGGQ